MAWLIFTALAVTVPAAVYLSGPRVEIDETIHPAALPDDLDAWLKTREGRFPDVVPGTEKIIRWAGPPGEKTGISLVYIHGFSATRQETAPLADRVAERLGANLFYTRLTGHGRSGRALAGASVNDWLNDAVEALAVGERLGERVVMIGSSTGGTLATWLAHRLAGQGSGALAALILISPNFRPADPFARILTWPWGGQIAELAMGPERRWEPENPGHGRYWTPRYPVRALLPMMGLVRLTGSLDLSRIRTPCLMIYSPLDQVVSPRAAEEAFAGLGSSRKQIFPVENSNDPSHHVLAGDILSPGTTGVLAAAIVRFVQSD